MQNKELQMTLISNINRLMHTHKISMRQLSSDIGCSDSYIQKVMAQEMDPSLDNLSNIAQRFQVPIRTLFETNVLRSAQIAEIDTYLIKIGDEELSAILQLSKALVFKNEGM